MIKGILYQFIIGLYILSTKKLPTGLAGGSSLRL